jgi:hypothetical protein
MVCKPPVIDVIKQKFDAVLFDLDGVVTKTAKVHAASWKRLFDEFLESRAAGEGESWKPLDLGSDYNKYVDGKPRYDGVKSFLESRGIDLPYGSPDDPPDAETVCGLQRPWNIRLQPGRPRSAGGGRLFRGSVAGSCAGMGASVAAI